MNIVRSIIPFVLVAAASPVLGQACVSSTFDRLVPGAQNVVSHISDVPSVQFPAFWQEGTLDMYRYRIFSNGDGVVTSAERNAEWRIAFSCAKNAESCTYETKGTPPETTDGVSKRLGACLLGRDMASAPKPADDSMVLEVPDGLATLEAQGDGVVACGRALADELTEAATLQRLLKMAGADPGPIDGFLGPKSFAAMDVFVEDAGWGTSISNTIELLDKHLCLVYN